MRKLRYFFAAALAVGALAVSGVSAAQASTPVEVAPVAASSVVGHAEPQVGVFGKNVYVRTGHGTYRGAHFGSGVNGSVSAGWYWAECQQPGESVGGDRYWTWLYTGSVWGYVPNYILDHQESLRLC